MEFSKGESVEWIIADKGNLILSRKEVVLHYLPEAEPGANGRPRRYGVAAPTPDALRQDENVPW